MPPRRRGGNPLPAPGRSRAEAAAEALDRAVIEFLKKLELEPQLVRDFVDRANSMVSETSGNLRGDLARVKEHLALVRGKLSNMVDILAEKGKAAMASLAKKLEELEAERGELERSESRLKKEL